jgi:hypothetical protein
MMRRWRPVALILAVVSLGLAAAGSADMAARWPLLGKLPLRAGHVTFFWVAVVCFLAAVWGRPGT